jgi:membrane protease YdiL (CAAX protease family)
MFDFTDRTFDAFIAPAKPRAKYWRLGLGMLIAAAIYAAVNIGFFLAIALIWGQATLQRVLVEMTQADKPAFILLMLLTIPLMLCGVWVAMRWLHKQRFRTLIGVGPTWRNFVKSTVFCLVLLGASTLYRLYLGEGVPHMTFAQWAPWALVLLPILLLQVATEELIFRGYLLQQFAALSKNPIAWMIVPSLLFGSLHYQPSKFGPDAALFVVAVTAMFGVLAADLTRRTGNIGAAVGLHFVNNLMAIAILPLNGTMTGIALYVTKVGVEDRIALADILWASVLWMIATLAVYFGIMAWLSRRRLQFISTEPINDADNNTSNG